MSDNTKIKASEFFSQELKNELENQNGQSCNGYLIIIDIKDSTFRKNEYKTKWFKHTEAIYKSFLSAIDKIESDVKNIEKITIKFIGDSVMAFFKVSDSTYLEKDTKPNTEISIKIINYVQSYLNDIEAQKDLIGDMRLKTVITYLTEIYIVNIDDKIKDVLGRGIDFSFRLEKYADSSHIIINQMLKDSICKNENKECYNDFFIIECKKKIKGWNTSGEDFYLLTNEEMIKNTFNIFEPSVYSNDVNMELFKFYINFIEKHKKEVYTIKENEKTDLNSLLDK